ncbi:MAG: FAA hydrolase family protein [Deltaproteobacteria bacterium]|nr:MAG: FAA hydrolase family protein [Deltaproteobacteria bacterium]
MPSDAIFLGCLVPAHAPWERRWIRMSTPGRAPDPSTPVEEIADPFAAVRAAAARGESTDLGDVVRQAPVLPHGLSGAVGSIDATIAPPVVPTKIVGVGRNYRDHAAELGNDVPQVPLLFFKPLSCLIGSGAPIVLPPGEHRIDFEGELVVVVGRRLRDAPVDEAARAVSAVCLGNDVSCRDLQRSDGQWTRAKGFDTFGPVGPFLRLVDGFDAVPTSARIRTYVGDALRQDGALADMVFSVGEVLAHLSACMTLEPGDVVFTGTPAGVGPLAPGETVRIECEGFDLGRLVNPVVAA